LAQNRPRAAALECAAAAVSTPSDGTGARPYLGGPGRRGKQPVAICGQLTRVTSVRLSQWVGPSEPEGVHHACAGSDEVGPHCRSGGSVVAVAACARLMQVGRDIARDTESK